VDRRKGSHEVVGHIGRYFAQVQEQSALQLVADEKRKRSASGAFVGYGWSVY
jgi:hypothetical protein